MQQAATSSRFVALQMRDQAVNDEDRHSAESDAACHVAKQHALGAPVRAKRDERYGPEGGAPPVQRRGVVRPSERIAGGIADEQCAEEYKQWRQPAAEENDQLRRLAAGVEE